MRCSFTAVISFAAIVVAACPLFAAEQTLTPRLHHLRLGKVPEWSDFPVEADGADLKLRFKSAATPASRRCTSAAGCQADVEDAA